MSSKEVDSNSLLKNSSVRRRKMTEKGLLYNKEQKLNLLRLSHRQLRTKQHAIEGLLSENPEVERVRQEHSQYLGLLDKHFTLREEYVKLLEEEEKKQFLEKVDIEEDPCIYHFKKRIESWFSDNAVQAKDSVSLGARSKQSSGSKKSSVSLKRLFQETKKAELKAKADSLKEVERLEMSKLKLKMEERELELKTELAIADAKTKVIDDFERSLDGSQASFPLKTSPVKSYVKSHTRVDQDQDNNILGNKTSVGMPQYEQMLDYGFVSRHLKKPQVNIKPFSGDPIDYRRFMRQFKSCILVNTDDTDEIINYLDQYTTGEANRIVSGYSYLEGRQAYLAIVDEFEERYGNFDTIASAFVKRALNWPQIRADNPKALDDFAIFLTECENAIQGIDSMKILDYPDNLKKLVMKLPFHYHDRWRNVVQQHKAQGHSITFYSLKEFVRKEAKKINDPIYGRRALSEQVKSSEKPRPKPKVMATSMLQEDQRKGPFEQKFQVGEKVRSLLPPCLYCKQESHGLELCNKWTSLAHENKLHFLRTEGLCFRCLRKGHRSNQCDMKNVCGKCNLNHQTVLHYTKPTYSNQQRRYGEKDSNVCASHTMDHMGAGEGDCTLAIVPVLVKMKDSSHAVRTYASLDPGSSVSFVSENLRNKLGCEGKRMRFELQTMGKPHNMVTHCVNDLEVSDMSGENVVQLPKVYSKDKMPVSQHHIPTQTDISQWPHLSEVLLPEINTEIGLLLGNNVPDAYSPLQVKTGPSGSPHATLTRLGWVVWNLVRNDIQDRSMFTVNRIEIRALEENEELRKLDRLVRHSMNLNFPERVVDDKKHPSYEDKSFMKKVEDSIKLENGHYTIALPFRRETAQLPSNHSQAFKRLMNLRHKMERNNKFLKDYRDFMDKIIAKGYAEKVPDHELERGDGRVWFIPHHGVYHPHKPNKIRVVFDCTAKHQGVSLNSRRRLTTL